jgi:hypothetical protein
MHTPAVLTFLHMLAACVVHLIAVSYINVPAPQLTAHTWKGASVHVSLSALQVNALFPFGLASRLIENGE